MCQFHHHAGIQLDIHDLPGDINWRNVHIENDLGADDAHGSDIASNLSLVSDVIVRFISFVYNLIFITSLPWLYMMDMNIVQNKLERYVWLLQCFNWQIHLMDVSKVYLEDLATRLWVPHCSLWHIILLVFLLGTFSDWSLVTVCWVYDGVWLLDYYP